MDKAKKIIKIVAIIIAVAAAVVGIAFAVKKIIDKKKAPAAIPAHPQPTDFLKKFHLLYAIVYGR